MKHKSDSSAQRLAEEEMRRLLSKQEQVPLAPVKLGLRNGATVNIDGFNEEARVLCEIYAHVGKTRGGQPHKIATDILKMIAVEKALKRHHRKILCFNDSATAACVTGKSWLAEVVRGLPVEVVIVVLTERTMRSLRAAQKRQIMVNR